MNGALKVHTDAHVGGSAPSLSIWSIARLALAIRSPNLPFSAPRCASAGCAAASPNYSTDPPTVTVASGVCLINHKKEQNLHAVYRCRWRSRALTIQRPA